MSRLGRFSERGSSTSWGLMAASLTKGKGELIARCSFQTSSSVRYMPRNHRVVVERTYRGLLATQRDRGLDLHSSVSGDVAGGRCDAGQDHRDCQVRDGIGGADADEKFADEACSRHGGEKTDR